ncbi:uncharacterized protein LOC131954266 [Physella acuta]|uniref:uncharacterized protein LOC131954266 n=1 Tax=Physella acuta TaxID=109671 RepID=UPI0027DC202A|nr:uncharacterized protein LOC131954266 [Physella acuta]XP_059173829.1 uncharacterized protein LOC131954266 [Physella acuta]XP_059173831.1 uncharacterized protein LOC131954266 [Physella acuta]
MLRAVPVYTDLVTIKKSQYCLLLMCFLQQLPVYSCDQLTLASISKSSDNNPGFMFPVGKPFKLICQLTESFCQETSSNDTLTLLPKSLVSGASEGTVTRITDCSVSYQIEDASPENSNEYICSKNGVTLMKEQITILEKPLELKIEKISVSENKDILITWLKSSNDMNILDEYNITMTESGITTQLCVIRSAVESSRITCQYANINKSDTVNNNNVTITILIARPMLEFPIQSLETHISINLVDYVAPGPVKNLHVYSVTSHTAFIIFQLSDAMKTIAHFLISRNKTFSCGVTLWKTDDSSEILQLELQNITSYNETIDANLSVAVLLNTLTAFMNYSCMVSCATGGGEGEKTFLQFTTKKSVPAQSPVIEKFAFSRVAPLFSSLFLTWQPLPLECIGANNLSYDVEVSSVDGFKNLTRVDTSYLVVTNQLPSHALKVEIWAVNEIGKSENSSQLIIPAYEGSQIPEAIVEFLNESSMNIYVNVKSVSMFDDLAVHWCHVNTDLNSLQELCQEYPITIFRSEINYEKTTDALKLTIPLNKPRESSVKRNNSKEVFYFHVDEENNFVQNFTTLATLKPSINLPDTNLNNMFEFAGKQRRRRAEPPALRILPIRSVTSQQKIQVFISLKINGNWMGMSGVNCTYNSSLKDASLTAQQVSRDQKNYLQVQQQCDPHEVKQYLITSYNIYSSTEETCPDNNRKFIALKNSSLFSPTEFELPDGITFACIAMNRHDGYSVQIVRSLTVATLVSSSAQGKILTIVFVVVGTVGLILLVPTFLCLSKKCKEGKQKFQTIDIQTQNTLDEASSGTDEVSDIPGMSSDDIELIVISPVDNDSSTGSGNCPQDVHGYPNGDSQSVASSHDQHVNLNQSASSFHDNEAHVSQSSFGEVHAEASHSGSECLEVLVDTGDESDCVEVLNDTGDESDCVEVLNDTGDESDCVKVLVDTDDESDCEEVPDDAGDESDSVEVIDDTGDESDSDNNSDYDLRKEEIVIGSATSMDECVSNNEFDV